MLASPRRASDNRIDNRNQALRSPGKSKKKAPEDNIDAFDLFAGAIDKAETKDDPFDFKPTRSASLGSKPLSARAASPVRGSPAYLAPVENPHKVEVVFSKELSSDEGSSDEKKNDSIPQGKKTDILVLMHEGMKMYKFGKKNSKPKQKTVYLSKDNRYLKWSSNLKKSEKTQVAIASIKRIEGGTRSEVYEQVLRLPRDGPLSLKPSFAISIYYEASPLKTKTLNLIATVNMHHQILMEGLRRLVKVCKSGGDPGNIVEIFHNINRSPDYHDSCSHLQREQKSFRWEKIQQDLGGPRSVSPTRECVEITTGTGVKLRPFSRSLPTMPPSSKSSVTAWV